MQTKAVTCINLSSSRHLECLPHKSADVTLLLKTLKWFPVIWDQTPVFPYGPLSSLWPDLCSSDFTQLFRFCPWDLLHLSPWSVSPCFFCPGILPTAPSSPGHSLQTSRKTCLYSFSLPSCSEHPTSATQTLFLCEASQGDKYACIHEVIDLLPPCQHGLWPHSVVFRKIYLLLEWCSALCPSCSLRALVEISACHSFY